MGKAKTLDEGATVADPDWYDVPVLAGDRVVLQPLTGAASDDLLRAADDPAIFAWLPYPEPQTVTGMQRIVDTALRARRTGDRLPWLQLSAATGEVIGTTSYYDLDPANRSLAIGHTWLSASCWRTGINVESKLLLLERAFDYLGAGRVVWHTDARNDRSRRAITGLGAQLEGLLRNHRLLPDGSWRTTAQFSMTDDDWPQVRLALQQRLARHRG